MQNMIHGTCAFTQIKHGSQCTGDITLGSLHGFLEGKPLGKIDCDGYLHQV